METAGVKARTILPSWLTNRRFFPGQIQDAAQSSSSVEQSSRTSSLGSDSRPAVVPQAPTPTPPQEAAAPRAELGHAASPSLGKRKASDDAGDAKAGGGEPQRHQKRKIEYAAVLQPSGAIKELKPLLALPWSLLPAVEVEDDPTARKPTSRKREWRGRGWSGPAAAKRLWTAVEFRSRDYEDLEDWEEGEKANPALVALPDLTPVGLPKPGTSTSAPESPSKVPDVQAGSEAPALAKKGLRREASKANLAQLAQEPPAPTPANGSSIFTFGQSSAPGSKVAAAQSATAAASSATAGFTFGSKPAIAATLSPPSTTASATFGAVGAVGSAPASAAPFTFGGSAAGGSSTPETAPSGGALQPQPGSFNFGSQAASGASFTFRSTPSPAAGTSFSFGATPGAGAAAASSGSFTFGSNPSPGAGAPTFAFGSAAAPHSGAASQSTGASLAGNHFGGSAPAFNSSPATQGGTDPANPFASNAAPSAPANPFAPASGAAFSSGAATGGDANPFTGAFGGASSAGQTANTFAFGGTSQNAPGGAFGSSAGTSCPPQFGGSVPSVGFSFGSSSGGAFGESAPSGGISQPSSFSFGSAATNGTRFAAGGASQGSNPFGNVQETNPFGNNQQSFGNTPGFAFGQPAASASSMMGAQAAPAFQPVPAFGSSAQPAGMSMGAASTTNGAVLARRRVKRANRH